MSMTSTEDIEKWFEGTQLCDGGDVEGALKNLAKVMQNSRILFNTACCYFSINDVEAAVEVVMTGFLLFQFDCALLAYCSLSCLPPGYRM